jgi:hypothetical protein
MRFLLLFFLLPFQILSQELPDSILAKQRNVRKLIILVCHDNLPCDSQNIFVLDGTWKNATGLRREQTITDPQSFDKPDTSKSKAVYDKTGRLVFIGPKNKSKLCAVDSAYCKTFSYDDKNRLVAEADYTCEKGIMKLFYHYDDAGKIAVITMEPRPDILVTREEYFYNKEGKLDSVISWWAIHPENPVRDSSDTKSCRVVYHYENGLIKEAIVDDPARCHYSLFAYWQDPENYISTSGHVVLRYVYVY